MYSTSIKPTLAFLVALTTTIGFANCGVTQEISGSMRKQIQQVKELVDEAGSLFKKKNFADSGEQVRQAQEQLVKLAGDGNPAVNKALRSDYDRIVKARKLLESKGQTFDSLPEFDSLSNAGSGAKGSDSKSAGSDSKGSDAKGSDSKGSDSKGSDSKGSDSKGSGTKEISFVNEVAPILVENCGQCHIEQSRGRYVMTNYNAIKKGSRKGVAVKPRDVEKSRMIELIASGKMPPAKIKQRVSDDQLEVLKTWIEQGAKFDGSSKQKSANPTTYVSAGGSDSKGSDSKAGSDTKAGSGSK